MYPHYVHIHTCTKVNMYVICVHMHKYALCEPWRVGGHVILQMQFVSFDACRMLEWVYMAASPRSMTSAVSSGSWFWLQ